MVWAALGIGLLAWSRPGEGQAARQHEAQLVQGQTPPELFQSQVPSRSVQPEQATVTVYGGTLSVSLQEAGLREVMEAISRQAGIKVSFLAAVGQTTLTTSFVGLPLEDGLRRLLQGLNYAFAYTETGVGRQIGQIFVMSGAPDQSPAALETVDEPGVAVTAALQQAVDSRRFVETLQAAITAAGGTVQEDPPTQAGVAPDLATALQRVLSGQAEPQLLQDQFRQAGDRLQQLLQQSGQ